MSSGQHLTKLVLKQISALKTSQFENDENIRGFKTNLFCLHIFRLTPKYKVLIHI